MHSIFLHVESKFCSFSPLHICIVVLTAGAFLCPFPNPCPSLTRLLANSSRTNDRHCFLITKVLHALAAKGWMAELLAENGKKNTTFKFILCSLFNIGALKVELFIWLLVAITNDSINPRRPQYTCLSSKKGGKPNNNKNCLAVDEEH